MGIAPLSTVEALKDEALDEDVEGFKAEFCIFVEVDESLSKLPLPPPSWGSFLFPSFVLVLLFVVLLLLLLVIFVLLLLELLLVLLLLFVF